MSARKARPKRENGEGSAYQIADGRWRADVTVGYEDRGDGTRRRVRQVVYAATEAEAKYERNELVRKVRGGEITVGGEQTVREWVAHWLDVIMVDAHSAPATISNYRNYADKWIIPVIGDKRLRQVKVEDIERVYSRMRRAGCAGSHVQGCHQALRRALKLAQRRGKLGVNPCDMMDPPRGDAAGKSREVQALTPDEARSVLDVCERWPNGTRWSVAFALGLRQGEALGLRETSIDTARSMVHVDRQLLRNYNGAGLRLAPPKSAAAQRWIAVPPSLMRKLQEQLAVNEAQRAARGDDQPPRLLDIDGEPSASPLVFTRADGRLITHGDDWRDWKALLEAAGVRYINPHGARHTCATLLLVQGVHPRVAAGILGHASTELFTGTYSHLVPELIEGAADAIEHVLYQRRPAKVRARPGQKSRHSGSHTGSHAQGSLRASTRSGRAPERPEPRD